MAAVVPAIVEADQPELLALAGLASLPASRLALAFNNPKRLFEHLTLEELGRLQGACERLGALTGRMVAATEIYQQAAAKALGRASESVGETTDAD